MRVLAYVILLSAATFLVHPSAFGSTVEEMYVPCVVTDPSDTTNVIIHNKQLDRSIVVAFVLVSNGSESPLSSVVLSPKETTTVDVTSLADAGRLFQKSSALVLRYWSDYSGPLDAWSVIQRSGNRSSVTLPLTRRNQIRGNVLESVSWLPNEAVTSVIAIQNTSQQGRNTVITVASAVSQSTTSITLPARTSTRISPINSGLRKALATQPLPVAIRVTYDGDPGDVLAAGTIDDDSRNFAESVVFHDLAHGEHHRTLGAQTILLGAPDGALGLPADMDFDSILTLRNTTAAVKNLSIAVKYLTNHGMESSSLDSPPLMAFELRSLDLSEEQRRGHIPADVHHAVIEVHYDGEAGHVIGEVLNLDRKTGLSFGSAMTTHESHIVSGSEWWAGAGDRTILSISNAGTVADTVLIDIFHGGVSYRLPPRRLSAGEFSIIDIATELAQVAPAVLDGDTPISGSFRVAGGHGMGSSIRLERLTTHPEGGRRPIIFTLPEGDTRVVSTNSDAGDSTTSSSGATQAVYTFPLVTIAVWSDNAKTDESDYSQYSADNPAHYQVNNPPSPTVKVLMDAADPEEGTILSVFYDPCGSQLAFASHISFGLPADAYLFYEKTSYGLCYFKPTCQGTCTSQLYASIAVFTGNQCFPPGEVYLQCYSLTINGKCVVRQGVCASSDAPGYCT
jgi:hypothetical protein